MEPTDSIDSNVTLKNLYSPINGGYYLFDNKGILPTTVEDTDEAKDIQRNLVFPNIYRIFPEKTEDIANTQYNIQKVKEDFIKILHPYEEEPETISTDRHSIAKHGFQPFIAISLLHRKIEACPIQTYNRLSFKDIDPKTREEIEKYSDESSVITNNEYLSIAERTPVHLKFAKELAKTFKQNAPIDIEKNVHTGTEYLKAICNNDPFVATLLVCEISAFNRDTNKKLDKKEEDKRRADWKEYTKKLCNNNINTNLFDQIYTILNKKEDTWQNNLYPPFGERIDTIIQLLRKSNAPEETISRLLSSREYEKNINYCIVLASFTDKRGDSHMTSRIRTAFLTDTKPDSKFIKNNIENAKDNESDSNTLQKILKTELLKRIPKDIEPLLEEEIIGEISTYDDNTLRNTLAKKLTNEVSKEDTDTIIRTTLLKLDADRIGRVYRKHLENSKHESSYISMYQNYMEENFNFPRNHFRQYEQACKDGGYLK